MAYVTKTQLANASTDANTLEKVLNDPETVEAIKSRLGTSLKPISRILKLVQDRFDQELAEFAIQVDFSEGQVASQTASFITLLADAVEALRSYYRVSYNTWAELNAVTDLPVGSITEVFLTDAGTHTDPVTSATVDNAGIYRYTVSGWQRVADMVQVSVSGSVLTKDYTTANGIVDDRAGIASADTIANGKELIFTPGVYKVDSNLTIASPVTFLPGAVLKPNSGVTITLSSLNASTPRQEVFDLSNGGNIVGTSNVIREVNNIAALEDIALHDSQQVRTLGYYTPGDGGENIYTYSAASTAQIDGGFVLPGNGGTLAINSSGVFVGVAGTGRLIANNRSVVNALKFGAKGDNSTDDTASIAAMTKALLQSDGGTAFFPVSKRFIITAPVEFPRKTSLIMQSPIVVRAANTATGTWVRLGPAGATSGSALTRQLSHEIWIERETLSDWVSENDVGIEVIDQVGCHMTIRSIYSFSVGIRWRSGYGNVRMGEIRNCGIGMDIVNDNPFPNASNFYGGHFAVNGTVNVDSDRTGIRVRGGTLSSVNTIGCDGQSYEISTSNTTGEAVCVVLDGTVNNVSRCRFLNQRVEGLLTKRYRVLGVTRNNIFQFEAVSSQPPVLEGDFAAIYEPVRTDLIDNLIFDSGDLKDAFYRYSATRASIMNLDFANNTAEGSVPTFGTATSGFGDPILNNDGTVEFGSRPGGIMIDTSVAKKFRVPTSVGGQGCRMICFNSYANPTSTIIAPGSVKRMETISPSSYQTTFGGLFNLGDDFFEVSSDVKAIFVSPGFSPGLPMRSFKVYADKQTQFKSLYSRNFVNKKIGEAIPTAGTWELGDILWNVNPVAGNFMGWVCTAAGTPGTWKTFGAISA